MKIILLLLVFPFFLLAQNQVQGIVKNAETGQAVEGASIFFNQTTIGTISDEKGKFQMDYPKEEVELIVSFLGFKTFSQNLVNTQSSIEILLQPIALDLETVNVISISQRKWKQLYRRFERGLLGESKNAKKCSILNPEVIQFETKKGSDFSATAEALLKIDNRALGYRLFFWLEHFEVNGLTVSYSGKPWFVLLEPLDEKEADLWKKNRYSAYQGSMRHFFNSLKEGSLKKEKFYIQLADLEGSTFRTIGDIKPSAIVNEDTKPTLRLQKFLKVIYSGEKSNLKSSSNQSLNNVAGQLKHPAEKDMAHQEADNWKKENNGQISWLFAKKSRVELNKDGQPKEAALLQTYGHWAKEGLADALPFDYDFNSEIVPLNECPPKNGFPFTNLKIPCEAIQQGGPPRDGIPSIDNPRFMAANEVDFLTKKERVLGVFYNGIAKAYPLKIMDQHEIVNDSFDGQPVAVTYCPLCSSGIAFDAVVGEKALQFGVSGLLYNSDVLLYDRTTESLWSQIEMKAVNGYLSGQRLTPLPTFLTTWEDWQKRYPSTLVLSKTTGFKKNYETLSYFEYRQSPELMFPVAHKNNQLPAKSMVIGVEWKGAYKAYSFKFLKKQTAPFVDNWNGKKLTIHYNPEAKSAMVFDENGDLLPAVTLYWFAWYAFHPETEIAR